MRKKNIILKFIIISIVIISMISCKPINNESSKNSAIIEQSSKLDISGKGDLWADKKLTVGFITPGAEGPWRTTSVNNILDHAKEWNTNLVHYDGQGKQELQIEQMENLIKKDVDAIGFVPAVEDGYEEVLAKVKEAKIPVILLDRTVNCADESLWTSHIVSDFYKQGEMAGEWLIDHLKKHGELDKKIKIVEISGTNGAEATIDRGQGFREAIKEKENLKITISRDGYFTQSGGYEVMQEILSETTDIDVLFCHNDDMAIGAIQAIEEAGLVPGEDIIIISIEGTNAALKAIVEGKIACSVECNPLMGDLFMEACVRLANGEEIEREIHPVDRVFDITNAQVEIDARKANGYGY